MPPFDDDPFAEASAPEAPGIPASPVSPAAPARGAVPPQSLEAEQAVLGAILLQPEALTQVLEIIGTDDFYRENHKIIFAAMLGLFERREPHDLVTVGALLADQNKLEAAGGLAEAKAVLAEAGEEGIGAQKPGEVMLLGHHGPPRAAGL